MQLIFHGFIILIITIFSRNARTFLQITVLNISIIEDFKKQKLSGKIIHIS